MPDYVVQEILPPAEAAKLPPLYSSEGDLNNAVVHVKLFHPFGAGTWYLIEYDGDDVLYGWHESILGDPSLNEMAYSSLRELRELRARVLGRQMPFQAIEREEHWTPVPLRQIRSFARYRDLPDVEGMTS